MTDRPEAATAAGLSSPSRSSEPASGTLPGRTAQSPLAPYREVEATAVRVHCDRHSMWRAGWTVVAVVALAAIGKWVLSDAGNVIFMLVMAVIASIAMEPAVARLSRRMRRGL